MRNGYKACQISLLIFLSAFSRGHDGAQRSMTFLSFYLFLFVCLLLLMLFFLQIKNVALICSINF